MDIWPKEKLEAATPGFGKSFPKHIKKCVDRYNRWVKVQRKKMSPWRPKPWRSDLKKPFKFTNMFYSTRDDDLENYPEIAAIDRDAETVPEEE